MKSKIVSVHKLQPYWLVGVLVVFVLLLAACAPGTSAEPTAAPAATTAPTDTKAAGAEAEINVVDDAALGKILVGANGMTLYMFTKDGPDMSNCDAACLAKWPPLVTQGSPKLGDGVDPALVGTAALADGRKIVTYNKMPLYYWVSDTKAGDTTGQGVGSVWYVVSPDGKVVGMEPAASEAEINVADDPALGKILVGANGMTLYMFTKDGPDMSNCDADCLAKWPPLVTQGSPKLGDGVDAALVGSAALADGRKIVTYNKMPLYYWVNDKASGDTTGQGVGSVWYVVSPDGKVVGMEPAVSSTGSEVELKVEDTSLGNILVGENDMTLYMFTKDGPNVSNCNADCLAKWPPFVSEGTPKLGDGVDAALVGSADLADGRKIVTYNKMPLYYWVNDKAAGDTTGQGVGSVWYVVAPDGKPVGMEPAAAADDAVLDVADNPTLGKILVGANGMTLYIFTNDTPGVSNCNADCLAKWPPLITQGNPKLGPGVDAALVGSADLADGRKIVTYNKMPLYYWVNDKAAGDTTGQGVGSVWYVISPDGKVVGSGSGSSY